MRRGVDPALVEMVTGNLFKLHIYPFAPSGTRHLVLQLTHQLLRNNGLDLYSLPVRARTSSAWILARTTTSTISLTSSARRKTSVASPCHGKVFAV